ncbi:hypothetical protein MNBD_GAMMA20-1756 [hydrothermal vent metagenome]|uniref:CAAX prenyl protease 2/Lysostaphin resistance protein A-like domain-containing protein n=1 Tax=hydrothermal vent metagenome TaxID=652676 RepID=A0A3B1AH99_9ZZZZ
MNACSPQQLKNLFQDRLFWLALLAGPVVWLSLFLGFPGTASEESSPIQWWWLLLLAGLYPLLEEWLFRGLLQPQLLNYHPLRARFLGLTYANLLTSLLFGVVHLIAHPPLWAAAVIVPSLVFGAFRDRYHSVVPAIVLHSFYNLGYFLIFWLT